MFRLFRKRKVKRLYVVTGEQLFSYSDPNYETDPSFYSFAYDKTKLSSKSPQNLPTYKSFSDDDSILERGSFIIKAFTRSKDSITFSLSCNLDSLVTTAYDLIDEKWTVSKDQSAFDIEW